MTGVCTCQTEQGSLAHELWALGRLTYDGLRKTDCFTRLDKTAQRHPRSHDHGEDVNKSHVSPARTAEKRDRREPGGSRAMSREAGGLQTLETCRGREARSCRAATRRGTSLEPQQPVLPAWGTVPSGGGLTAGGRK